MSIGGKDVRITIKKALDGLMTRELKFQFSKDGWKERGHSAKRNTTDVWLVRVNFIK